MLPDQFGEDQFIRPHLPHGPCLLHGLAVFPERHRRDFQVAVPGLDTSAAVQFDPDGREVAGIVADDHLSVPATNITREGVGPVAQVEQMDSVTTYLPLLTWQETHPKRLHVEGDVAGHFAGERFPLGGRCAAKARMNAVVVATDFQGKPSIELSQGHRRHGFRVIAAFGRDRRLSCSRQEMHRAHHGPDQPLDMSTKVRASRRSIDQIDPPFGAGRLKSA